MPGRWPAPEDGETPHGSHAVGVPTVVPGLVIVQQDIQDSAHSLDLDKIYYRGMEGGLSEERRAKPTRSHRTCLISLTVIFENFCDMWTCEEHYKEMQYSEFIGNLSHRCPVHSRYQWSILTQKQAFNINHTDCAHSLGCAPFLWVNGWNLPEKQFLRCQVKANFVTARLWGKAYLVLWAFMDRMDRVLSILHC